MTARPAFSDQALSASAFAHRVALSVLAVEIDELLHRSAGGDTFAPRPLRPADPAAFPPASPQPQTAGSS